MMSPKKHLAISMNFLDMTKRLEEVLTEVFFSQ